MPKVNGVCWEEPEIDAFSFAVCGLSKKYYTADTSFIPHAYSSVLDIFMLCLRMIHIKLFVRD